MPVAASKRIQNKEQKYKPEDNSTCGRIKQHSAQLKYLNQNSIFFWKQLIQNLFNVTLTEMDIVTMTGAETDCPRFNPKTISNFF